MIEFKLPSLGADMDEGKLLEWKVKPGDAVKRGQIVAVVVDETWRTGSLAAEIIARIAEEAFYDLDAPPARVCSEEVPIPYAKHLEEAALPQPAKILAAVKTVLGR